jgi:hypothetical protein
MVAAKPDCTGQKFGRLTVLSKGPVVRDPKGHSRSLWNLRCDCGNEIQLVRCNFDNCGADIHQPCVHYPPTPSPYPADAAAIAQKYLRLAKWHGPLNDSEIEDRRMDRLLRAAWIITYRRISGESISAIHEERLIKKHIRFARLSVTVDRLKRKYGRYNKRNITTGIDVATISRSPSSTSLTTPSKSLCPSTGCQSRTIPLSPPPRWYDRRLPRISSWFPLSRIAGAFDISGTPIR